MSIRKLLLLFLAVPCLANGPKYVGPNKSTSTLDKSNIYQEFINVYHDIQNPVINNAIASTETVKFISISTATCSSCTVTNLNVTNSANSSTYTITGLQVYGIFYSSTVYDTSGSSATTLATFVPTKTAITFTPKRTTSRVEISFSGVLRTSAGATANAFATLFRGSTNLAPSSNANFCTTDANLAGGVLLTCGVGGIIDFPNTVSPVTYTVEMKSSSAGTEVDWNPTGETGTITIKEWSY